MRGRIGVPRNTMKGGKRGNRNECVEFALTVCYSCPLLLFVVQWLGRVWLLVTSWTAGCLPFLSFKISWSLLTLMSIELMISSNHLILCCPLFLLPSILPSIRVFSNELTFYIRWPKFWNFSFSISPFNEYSGLISFRIDWFELLAGQGTLKSLLQHQNLKASILQCSTFFMIQFSYPDMSNEKNIALTTQIFVGKEMSLVFNTLSRLVITFLTRIFPVA